MSEPALLYYVRGTVSPQAFTNFMLSDTQLPPREIRLTPLTPGINCYIDGAHIQRPVSPGTTIIIGPAQLHYG